MRRHLSRDEYFYYPNENKIILSSGSKKPDSVILIVNNTRNHILYNSACADKGGTISGKSIDLDEVGDNDDLQDELIILVEQNDHIPLYIEKLMEHITLELDKIKQTIQDNG